MKFSIFYLIGFIIVFLSLGFWATIGLLCVFIPLAMEIDALIMKRRR